MEVEINEEFEAECPLCEGSGVIEQVKFPDGDGGWNTFDIRPEKCHLCEGEGEIVQYVVGMTEINPPPRNEGYM